MQELALYGSLQALGIIGSIPGGLNGWPSSASPANTIEMMKSDARAHNRPKRVPKMD